MATDLRDRLTDLAGHTPPGAPPADLWSRGVRRRRVGQVTTALVAAVLVLLVGVGGLAWQSATTRVEPAAPRGAPHLPDRFYWRPSPWLAAFAGPPGPLVQVFPTVRNTLTGQTNGLVGVTGSSGTYGFLDLPDDAVLSSMTPGGGFALAPDGRHLAFWVSGAPHGRPNTSVVSGVTITGVGVYDAVTGQTRISRLPTEHGLQPDLLLWSDDSRLLLNWYQFSAGDTTQDSTTAYYDAAATWDVGAPHPVTVPEKVLPAYLDSGYSRATSGVVVAAHGTRTFGLLDPAGEAPVRGFVTDHPSDLLVPRADGARVAGVIGHNVDTGPLAVGAVPAAGSSGNRVRLHVVRGAGHDWIRVLAWVDDDHVAMLERTVVRDPVTGPHVAGRIQLVDLRTGASRPLVEEFGSYGTNDSDSWLATSYLSAPVVHASPPPSPRSPREIAALWGLALTVTLGCLLVVWRRRAQRT